MKEQTAPLGTITKDGKTITILRVIEQTPEECLTALINARTPYEFYIVMREIGFTVHIYDDSISIGLDLVGDVMEFSGNFLGDYEGDNPSYSTLLWDNRYAFIDAYREKVVKEKED